MTYSTAQYDFTVCGAVATGGASGIGAEVTTYVAAGKLKTLAEHQKPGFGLKFKEK